MNFETYEKSCLDTASYPNMGNNLNYTLLGWRGETGEISEKFKKQIRQSDIFTNEDLAKELGDVLWYKRMTLYELKLDFKTIFPDYLDFNSIGNDGETLSKYELLELMDYHRAMATNYAMAIALINFNNTTSYWTDFKEHFKISIVTWCYFCYNIGSTPNLVAELNIKKLADRKERGVIKSNGDNR